MQAVLGIIGGSGLYELPGLRNAEWRRVEGPWGDPSDDILFAELNGAFALALAADDYPGFTAPAGARFTIPSWNVPDIFAGLSADYPSIFIPSPLRRHSIAYGDFNEAVAGLRGGGAAFFDLSGTQSTVQLLDLRGSSGSAPPSTLRMAILRVQ